MSEDKEPVLGSIESRLSLLESQVDRLRLALIEVRENASTARLQVQNHEHSPANGRALFPAAVFHRPPTNTPD